MVFKPNALPVSEPPRVVVLGGSPESATKMKLELRSHAVSALAVQANDPQEIEQRVQGIIHKYPSIGLIVLDLRNSPEPEEAIAAAKRGCDENCPLPIIALAGLRKNGNTRIINFSALGVTGIQSQHEKCLIEIAHKVRETLHITTPVEKEKEKLAEDAPPIFRMQRFSRPTPSLSEKGNNLGVLPSRIELQTLAAPQEEAIPLPESATPEPTPESVDLKGEVEMSTPDAFDPTAAEARIKEILDNLGRAAADYRAGLSRIEGVIATLHQGSGKLLKEIRGANKKAPSPLPHKEAGGQALTVGGKTILLQDGPAAIMKKFLEKPEKMVPHGTLMNGSSKATFDNHILHLRKTLEDAFGVDGKTIIANQRGEGFTFYPSALPH